MLVFPGCKSSSMSRLISGILRCEPSLPRKSLGSWKGNEELNRNWKGASYFEKPDSQSFGFGRTKILPGNSQEWRLTGLPLHVVMIFIDFCWKEIVDSDLTTDLGSYIARRIVGLHFHISDQSMSIHFTEPELRSFLLVLRVFFSMNLLEEECHKHLTHSSHPKLYEVSDTIFVLHFGPIKHQYSWHLSHLDNDRCDLYLAIIDLRTRGVYIMVLG